MPTREHFYTWLLEVPLYYIVIKDKHVQEITPHHSKKIIISASRRTDIPAFYSGWFFQRLKAGYVFSINPFNSRQVRRISLLPANIACIVFWTRNPGPILDKIALLEFYKIPFYFLITINNYCPILEPAVLAADEILSLTRSLAARIGSEKILWRYDPIILTAEIDRKYHYRAFEYIAHRLEGFSKRCVISFFQNYKKSLRNLAPITPRAVLKDEKLEIASKLSRLASKMGISLQWCAPDDDITEHECDACSIMRLGCIDATLIEKITGIGGWKRDTGQRKNCLCAQSIDIGAYNTCVHGCRYCYATTNHERAYSFFQRFDQNAAALILQEASQFSSLPLSSKSKNLPI